MFVKREVLNENKHDMIISGSICNLIFVGYGYNYANNPFPTQAHDTASTTTTITTTTTTATTSITKSTAFRSLRLTFIDYN